MEPEDIHAPRGAGLREGYNLRSYVRGNYAIASDIDILVVFDEEEYKTLKYKNTQPTLHLNPPQHIIFILTADLKVLSNSSEERGKFQRAQRHLSHYRGGIKKLYFCF
ncbi:MAG: nucleotidyltransferase domain-containing protein [Candidatus Bathyarchaeia archaeon]